MSRQSHVRRTPPWAQRGFDVSVTLPFRMVRREVPFLSRNALGVQVVLYDTNWVCSYPAEKVAEYADGLREAGIHVSVHGPIHDLNPGSLDIVIRDYTRHCYFKTLALCHALKAESLVLHLGVNPLLPESALSSWLEASIKTWRPLIDLAEQLSISMRLENMFLPSPRFLIALKDGLKSDAVKFCFDIGHFNVYSRVPLSQWLDELGQNLAEVHLNDNMGHHDEHLALGRGTVDFRRFFRELAARNIVPQFTLEMVRDKFEASLDYLGQNNLFEFAVQSEG